MRKYGKYERMPDGTRAKQPEPKAILLQTYFTSLLCMLLCVTMFFGTTFAWFTSDVVSEGNEIYIGTLDAELEVLKGSDWYNVETNPDVKLFDDSIAWEPGYTSLETIRITKGGDLSFRYALTFTDGKIDGNTNDPELLKIAQYFTVYVHAGEFKDAEDPKPATFADIETSAAKADGTWRAVKMGNASATLADILTQELPVLDGIIENDAAIEADTYIIALHMSETAGEGATEEDSIQLSEDMMGKRIGLNVKLTAHQQTYESDAFNPNYDLGAFAQTLAKVTPLEDKTINYYWGLSGSTSDSMTLDTAYQFEPTMTLEEAKASPYVYYLADFVVWADKDVPGDSMALAGYYHEWCQHKNNQWIALTTSDTIPANTPIRLVEGMGNGSITVNYEALCEYGNDGIGFRCGAADITNEKVNAGTTITVQLRLYETYSKEECLRLFGYASTNKQTGKYIVVGEYSYTFPAATTP